MLLVMASMVSILILRLMAVELYTLALEIVEVFISDHDIPFLLPLHIIEFINFAGEQHSFCVRGIPPSSNCFCIDFSSASPNESFFVRDSIYGIINLVIIFK